MKKILVMACVAGFAVSGAAAGDLQSHCEAVSAEMEGGDPSGCACLAETADDAVTAELMEATAETDSETFSEAAQTAIAACWPEAEDEA